MNRLALLFGRPLVLAPLAVLLGAGAPAVLGQPAAESAVAARRNPAVAAALELPRTTAAEQVRAVLTLLDLGYPQVAAEVFRELQQLRLTEEERAAVARQFGTGAMLQLIRHDPPGAAEDSPLAGAREFAQACLDAAATAARDPQRIRQGIAQLASGDPGQAYAAGVDLRAAGEPALAALFAALAQEEEPPRRGALLGVLREMRPAAELPLLAVLAEGSGRVQRDAAELAGHWRLSTAIPLLAPLAATSADESGEAARKALLRIGVPLPAADEAAALLERELSAAERPSSSAPTELPDELSVAEHEPEAVWWTWDDERRQLQYEAIPPSEFTFRQAARLAAVLGRLTNDPAVRYGRWLPYGLEAALRGGAELPAEVGSAVDEGTADQLSDALASAIARRQFRAAERLVEALGARGDDDALASADGLPSPLAEAVQAPRRSLRFAALKAVMQIDPQQSYAGSSQVLETLWGFALGAGPPAALAAAPDATRATRWAAEIRGLGYDATAATSGREVIRLVADPVYASRLAVIAVDSRLSAPAAREVAYQLRNYAPLRGTPIVLLAAVTDLAAMEDLAARDPLLTAAVQPADAAGMAAALETARRRAADEATTPEARRQQAAEAIGWLARLQRAGGPYDELPRHADRLATVLGRNELAAASLDLLAALGTGSSQSLLVDAASSSLRPAEQRRQAVAALAQSVARFGVQLTRSQVREQYARYNASEFADEESQQILARILDALEQR
jgi:hypothetical protein